MSPSTRSETIATPDGGTMQAHLALPDAGRGPGLVVGMEVFGVGDYIREATERLAGLGYVALAPDLYRRSHPGRVFGRGEQELQEAMAASAAIETAAKVDDLQTAMDHLRGLPEVTGPVGVLGFCLGGHLAYALAVASDPACAVCYYGAGIPETLDQAPAITCPVALQWGAEDPFIPVADAEKVCAFADVRPGWECHIQPDGGHAFDNWDNPMFHRPEAAARAWEQTKAFLAHTLPVP